MTGLRRLEPRKQKQRRYTECDDQTVWCCAVRCGREAIDHAVRVGGVRSIERLQTGQIQESCAVRL
jgi:hypothetical protein